MTEHAPDLALERYNLGEIEGTASAVWIPHMESCAECKAALAELKRDDATAKVRPGPRWIAPVLALAASVTLFFVLRPPPSDGIKGGGVLSLAIEGQPWAGEPIAPDARAQLVWSSIDRGYLAVIGVQRDGSVTVLHPEDGSDAALTEPGRATPLGGSLVIGADHDGARFCAFHRAEAFRADARDCTGAASVLQIRVRH